MHSRCGKKNREVIYLCPFKFHIHLQTLPAFTLHLPQYSEAYICVLKLLPLSEIDSKCSRRHHPAPQSAGDRKCLTPAPHRGRRLLSSFLHSFFFFVLTPHTLPLLKSISTDANSSARARQPGIFHLLSCLEDAQSQRCHFIS